MCNYCLFMRYTKVNGMPNFDGTGPLKRGRIIGRGLGHCTKGTICDTCGRKAKQEQPEETAAAK